MSLIGDLILAIQNGTLSFKTIDHAWTMQPFEKPSENSPALFLCPGKETTTPTDFDSCVIQNVTSQVTVFYVVPIGQLESMQSEARTVCLGWQYNENYTPLEYQSGEVKDISGGHIWYQETYSTTYQIRSQ